MFINTAVKSQTWSVFVEEAAFLLMILNTGVLIIPYPDLLPDVFCLMVRIFRLMLILLGIPIEMIFLQL
jgi:hypothetical protein